MNLSLGIHDFLSQFACKIEGQNGINRQKGKFFTSTACWHNFLKAGQVWKRVWILKARSEKRCGNVCLVWKRVRRDLENRPEHPHQEFPGVTPLRLRTKM